MADTLADCLQVRRREHGRDYALFDPTRTWRYKLVRRWGTGPNIVWIMLNPSTADGMTDDATIRRVRAFTQKFAPSAGGLQVINLYALRATDPAELWRHPDPVGPAGDDVLHGVAGATAMDGLPVIAAWGTHGARNDRGQRVAAELDAAGVRMLCLGTTKDGHPRHPLYLPGNTRLEPYTAKVVAYV